MPHVLLPRYANSSGGFCLQLSHLYPNLKFIVQDRAPAVAQAENLVWPKENPTALKDGRVSFMAIDFFEVNPVKNADIYWLRYIKQISISSAGFFTTGPMSIVFRYCLPSNPVWDLDLAFWFGEYRYLERDPQKSC